MFSAVFPRVSAVFCSVLTLGKTAFLTMREIRYEFIVN